MVTGVTVWALLLASLSVGSDAMVTKRQATYSYLGCRTDSVQNRVLTGKSTAYDTMTVQSCQADCAGFTYAGIEYGRECWCGNTLAASSAVAQEADCSFPCPGNNAQKCGAGDRLSLYILGSGPGSTTTRVSSTLTTTTRASSATTTRSSVPGTTTTTRTTTTTVQQQASGFPSGWSTAGCWVDGAQGRILADRRPDNAQLTLQSCVSACSALGYSIAGAEYGVECYCGHVIDNGGVLAASESQCSMSCGGNPNQKCGAGGRLTMYSNGPIESRGAQKTNLPAGWTYQGCIQDNVPNVPASDGGANLNIYTFPYKVWSKQTNDATSCISRCAEYGFAAAGLEYGVECFCGDPRDIIQSNTPSTSTDPRVPSFRTRSANPETYPDAQCDIACPGNPKFQCGAGNKLTWYAYTGTTAKPFLAKWNYPTGVNAGQYSLLIGGRTVPLITTQGINGKVAFVEKGGTGLGNGTGAYELDLSQINNFDAAWRTQEKYATDVFCAGGLTLPDRKGRVVTVGGWAGQDLLGIRIWTPDGTAGVKGTAQWQEDAANIQLQRPRWYPSAMTMANGSLLIMGGEIGNNDAAEPTVELFPPTGGKPVYLDFLDRTWPDNLYPFICVIPSGIFVAYFNEARILDAGTFATIKTLPNMPGSVADATSGRTYSLEGTMVLLPQHAPYTNPLGVLICGGSTSGNPAGLAIDNCISTQPEAANPTWLVERMPSRRVLPCMAGLPDGTYLIVNGGQQGVAGFGLASAPNLNAVLYDPTKPVHNRMSVMANTTVARMYHSEAIVLLDGRVMISGSDPTGNPNPGAGMYPNEFRVEVFTPPYLLSGAARPTFTITNKDWSYGQAVTFNVGGSTADIRVSLLGSVVSTHGNSMGQRTVFPAVSCAGQTCTVTSPPNAGIVPPGWYMMFVLSGSTPSVGQFVRIGGDPAQLGNWPQSNKFLPRPGVGAV